MRIIEITNGLQVPISNEEADLLKKFVESEVIEKSALDEREQYLANQLVNKDALQRRNIDGKIIYKKISN